MELRPGGRTITFFSFFCLSGESESLGKAAIYLRGFLFYDELKGGLIAQRRRGGKVDNGTFRAEEVMTAKGRGGLSVLCTSLRDAASSCTSSR